MQVQVILHQERFATVCDGKDYLCLLVHFVELDQFSALDAKPPVTHDDVEVRARGSWLPFYVCTLAVRPLKLDAAVAAATLVDKTRLRLDGGQLDLLTVADNGQRSLA